jgi:chaperonin GroEL
MLQIRQFASKARKIVPKARPTFKSVLPRYGSESRRPLVEGIIKLSKTASLTLGPGGRNIALDNENGQPRITKDGVTVVKTIFEKDRARDLGAKLLKRVAGNTNVYAGDGTTTSALISQELVQRGFKAIEFQGAHPIAVKRGMDKALKVVLGFLKEIAMPISQPEEVRNVCLVSSNYNEKVSDVISQVLMTVGLEGTMNIIESPTGLSDFKLVNGLIFQRGMVTPNFVHENADGDPSEMSVNFDQPLVLVVGDKIKDVS